MKKRLNINDIVNETILEFGNVKLHCKLGEILENVGMNIMELSDLTGIRYASLYELVHDKKVTLNLQHVLAVMVALRISKMEDIFELVFEDEERAKVFHQESHEAHELQRGVPDYVSARRNVNKQRVLEWKEEYKKTLEQ